MAFKNDSSYNRGGLSVSFNNDTETFNLPCLLVEHLVSPREYEYTYSGSPRTIEYAYPKRERRGSMVIEVKEYIPDGVYKNYRLESEYEVILSQEVLIRPVKKGLEVTPIGSGWQRETKPV